MNKTEYPLLFLMLLFPLTLSAAAVNTVDRGVIKVEQLNTMLGDPSLVIIEVGWGGPEEYYDKGHIPGSIHVNTDEIEYDLFNARQTSAPKKLGRSTTAAQDSAKGLSEESTLPRNWWNLYPDQYLLKAIAAMGVDTQSTVVIYAKDPTAAARLGWALLYAGVEDVSLLDGGFEVWESAGYEISTVTTPRRPKAGFGADRPLHPEYLVDIPFVRSAVTSGDDDFTLADIRTKGEFDGTSAPYSYIPTKGRVQSAVWGKAGDGPWTMENYLNKDGTFKSLQTVESMWAEQGITREKHVGFYCGTGWRSSLAFFFAYRMGWPRISNFDSGWYEWSMGEDAAINPSEYK